MTSAAASAAAAAPFCAMLPACAALLPPPPCPACHLASASLSRRYCHPVSRSISPAAFSQVQGSKTCHWQHKGPVPQLGLQWLWLWWLWWGSKDQGPSMSQHVIRSDGVVKGVTAPAPFQSRRKQATTGSPVTSLEHGGRADVNRAAPVLVPQAVQQHAHPWHITCTALDHMARLGPLPTGSLQLASQRTICMPARWPSIYHLHASPKHTALVQTQQPCWQQRLPYLQPCLDPVLPGSPRLHKGRHPRLHVPCSHLLPQTGCSFGLQVKVPVDDVTHLYKVL
jgi:hypothetical protein